MTPEQSERISEIFEKALSRPWGSGGFFRGQPESPISTGWERCATSSVPTELLAVTGPFALQLGHQTQEFRSLAQRMEVRVLAEDQVVR
jgi:hypothetical protein